MRTLVRRMRPTCWTEASEGGRRGGREVALFFMDGWQETGKTATELGTWGKS